MALRTSTLRPGLLVGLKTSLTGNVKYRTREIEAESIASTGEARAVWETEKTVADAAEQDRGTEARGKARHTISRVCANSAFGLLCPEDRTADLEEAITEARKIAEAFNAGATYSRLSINVIAGRIAADDVNAMRAINSEVRDLLAAMESGVEKLDAAAIRDAANKAKNLGAMLTPAAAARMQEAIDAARSAARRIVKAGETAAQEVDTFALRRIASARTEFLDMDDAREMAAPVETARALDLEPDAEHDAAATLNRAALVEAADNARALDMDEDATPVSYSAPAAPQFALDLI